MAKRRQSHKTLEICRPGFLEPQARASRMYRMHQESRLAQSVFVNRHIFPATEHLQPASALHAQFPQWNSVADDPPALRPQSGLPHANIDLRLSTPSVTVPASQAMYYMNGVTLFSCGPDAQEGALVVLEPSYYAIFVGRDDRPGPVFDSILPAVMARKEWHWLKAHLRKGISIQCIPFASATQVLRHLRNLDTMLHSPPADVDDPRKASQDFSALWFGEETQPVEIDETMGRVARDILRLASHGHFEAREYGQVNFHRIAVPRFSRSLASPALLVEQWKVLEAALDYSSGFHLVHG